MAYAPNQRPWSPDEPWQGVFDLATNLPNVAGSPLQLGVPNVQVGDVAWVTGGASPGWYVCSDPTLGAAVWELVPTGGGGSGIIGPQKVVYLEMPAPNGRGNDATGARGNAALPFATWNAAWAAMLSGDQMRIAPGSFAATAPVTTPNSWSVVGAGRAQTRISGAVNMLNVPSTGTDFLLQGVFMDSSGGGGGERCLRVTGTGGAGVTLADGGFIYDCRLRSDAAANVIEGISCQRITIRDTRIQGGNLDANTCHFVTWDVFMDGGDVIQRWAATADTPTRDTSEHHAMYGPNADVLFEGAPWVRFFPDCQLNNFTSNGPLTDIGGGATGTPRLDIWCRGAGLVVVLPSTATACPTDLGGSIWSGVVDLLVTGGALVQTVTARNMVSLSSAANQVIARAGISLFTFGDASNDDILQTIGTGTITPSRWTRVSPIALVGATDVFYGFTASAAPRFAVASPAVPGTGAIGVAPAADRVVATPAVNGSAYIEVRWA